MIRYNVVEDKKTVVAILETINKKGENITEKSAYRKLKKILGHEVDESKNPYLKMPKHYSAKVVCHECDEFDAETGKKLAKLRVKEKYHNALKRRIKKYYDNYKKEMSLIENYLAQDEEN